MAIDEFNPGRNGGDQGDCEMSSDCKGCKMRRQHYCWNHMREDQRQLIVRASGDFKDSLHIPWEVGSHSRSMVSETMNLEAPNGIFRIGVCREMGALVLRSGWDKFVTAHHIEENYRFLFAYRGNSTFKVHIFNPASLEKPSFCSQPPSHGEPCDPHVLNEKVLLDHAHVQTSTDFGYTTLPGCRVTKAQDEKVLDIAQTMRSEIPLYVATMNRSNVSWKDCSVNMPLRLVDHFKEDISKATIELEDSDCNRYSVEASKHTDDQIVLQSGWYDFVVSHRIRENDLLIFRSKGRTRLQVLILGLGSHQRTSSAHTVYSTSSSDDDHIAGEDTRKSSRWQNQVPDRCAKTLKEASTSSPSAKSEQALPDPAHVQASTDFGYTTLPGCRLSKAKDEKVLDIARTIRSEIPLYVATMNKSNVHLKDCSVNMPLRLLDHFKEDISKATIELEDSDSNRYPVEASKYSDDQIVLQSGWYGFVVSHHIRENDLLIFRSKGRTLLQVLVLGPGSHQRTSSPHTAYDVSSSDDDHIVEEDTRRSARWQKQVPDRCAKTRKLASTSSPSDKSGYEARELNDRASLELGVHSEPLSSNNLAGPSQRPYILPECTTLTGLMKKKVEEKVQTIRSELPIFVALMTGSMISVTNAKLRFCTEYGRSIPERRRGADLVLEMEGSKMEWRTTLNTDRNGGRWILAGWTEFVADNHLQLGDIVLFQVAKSTEGRMAAGRSVSGFRMTVYLVRKSDIEE